MKAENNLNQLDFFISLDSPKVARKKSLTVTKSRRPSQTQVANSSYRRKIETLNPFVALDCQQEVYKYFQRMKPYPAKLIIISGASGSGKTYFLRNLHQINNIVRQKIFSSLDMEDLAGFFEDTSTCNLVAIDSLEKFPLIYEQRKQMWALLKKQLESCSVILTATSFAAIKHMLPHELWVKSILLSFNEISRDDIKKYTQEKYKEMRLETPIVTINNCLNQCLDFASVDHLLLNVQELGKNSILIKESNLLAIQQKTEGHWQKVDRAVEDICTQENLCKKTLFSISRKKAVVELKHYTYWKLKKNYHFTYKQIANYFSVDHTSIMYSVKKLEAKKES